MLNSSGLKLLLRVGIGGIGSVTLRKFIGALMVGLFDWDVHGRTRVVMLELLEALERATSPLRLRSCRNHDFVRPSDDAVTGRGF
jgi:hypothetical protein